MIIKKPTDSDLKSIIDVLGFFHFKELKPTNLAIDDEWGEKIEILNSPIELDLEHAFIAEEDGKIIGFSHYRKIDDNIAETTLMVVNPAFRSLGAGRSLQEARMNEAFGRGFKKMRTWCSKPETQEWYKKNFEYKCVDKKSVYHSIYIFTYDNRVLSSGVQYGFKEYPEQEILECNLPDYYNKKFSLSWYKEEYGDVFSLKPKFDKPLIINAAVTGMVPTKEDNHNVPISPEEIINDAEACFLAGASIIHLHARDENGKPTWKKSFYEQIIPEIRRRCPGIICCVTTSGRLFNDINLRSEVLTLEGNAKPDMASITLGSLNFPTTTSINSPDTIKALALMMKEKGIQPECEVFESGMLHYASYLMKKEIIDYPLWMNILLGSLGTMPAGIDDFMYMIGKIPPNTNWAATGIGRYQLPINLISIMLGGNVRVGLEDNLYMDFEKKQLASNKELIKRLADFSVSIGRPIASAQYTRSLLENQGS